MGGFMLREEGQKDRVLGFRTLMKYYKEGRLDLSSVTEDRTNDHSKADGTSSSRKFELATAALVLLSLVIYFLWWNKPFNAGVPITITLLPAEMDSQLKDDANSRPEPVEGSFDTSIPIADAINPFIPYARPVEATRPDIYSVDEATHVPLVETNYLLRQSDQANPTPGPARSVSAEANDDAFSQTLAAMPPSPESAHPRVHLVSCGSGTSSLPSSVPKDGPSLSPDGAPSSFSQNTASSRRAHFSANSTNGGTTSPIAANPLPSNGETSSLLNAGEGIIRGISPTRGISHLLPDSQTADRSPRSPSIESEDSSDGFHLGFLFFRIGQVLSGSVEDRSRPSDDDPYDVLDDSTVPTVPSFYSVPADSEVAYLQMGLASFSAAALFGSIHCIGWSSKIVFASHAASLAWRIASVVITASPAVWCLLFVYAYAGAAEGCEDGCVAEDACYHLEQTWFYVSMAIIPLYIASRLVFLVLALVELRHIPPGALASIQWANVLPFIH
ncbi:hypothetical protein CPC08DRAFT_758904 [Agrocybe pediades]|nr:hypothetical protein CPC08DRAFT_758904 [Agrocybe pediades]